MTKSNRIYIVIAGLGIGALFTMGIGNNLFPEVSGGGNSFPLTACESVGGVYDHWDKVIFTSAGANLKDASQNVVPAGKWLEFKFPQSDPFAPVYLSKLVADHLNALGWTNGGGNPVQSSKIVIIDVDYSASCIFPEIVF